MNNDKNIAQRIYKEVGGNPKVIKYWDDENQSDIDIYIGENRPNELINTYATIGLSNYDIGLSSNNKKIRVEFIGACQSKYTSFGNIISSCAFNIINSNYSIAPGTVYPNVIEHYYDYFTMKHILFTTPFLWEQLGYIQTDQLHITWLMVIPISENELEYITNNSVEDLENKFVENQIDVFDLNRKSVL